MDHSEPEGRQWFADSDSLTASDVRGARIPTIYLQHLIPLLVEAKGVAVDIMDSAVFRAPDVPRHSEGGHFLGR